jgi:hypothetical protein
MQEFFRQITDYFNDKNSISQSQINQNSYQKQNAHDSNGKTQYAEAIIELIHIKIVEATRSSFISPRFSPKSQATIKLLQPAETQRDYLDDPLTGSNLSQSKSGKTCRFPKLKFSISKKLTLDYLNCSHPWA